MTEDRPQYSTIDNDMEHLLRLIQEQARFTLVLRSELKSAPPRILDALQSFFGWCEKSTIASASLSSRPRQT